jgi:hypothetical protein
LVPALLVLVLASLVMAENVVAGSKGGLHSLLHGAFERVNLREEGVGLRDVEPTM